MKICRLIIAILCVLTALPMLSGQDSVRVHTACVSAQYGFIVPHTNQMSHLITGHSRAVSAEWLFRSNGQHHWHHAYNFPENGIRLFVNNTGNSEQLGTQWVLLYTTALKLNRTSAPSGPVHTLTLGCGPGFASKRWDLEENHQAPVLGSHLNMSLSLRYRITLVRIGDTEFYSGLDIVHLSNGSFRVPNLGTNNVSLFLATAVASGNRIARPARHADPEFERNSEISCVGSWGVKQIPPPQGKHYSTWSLSADYSYRLTYKSSLDAGVDVFYNTSLRTLLERRDDIEPSVMDVMQTGVHLGYFLHMGKFRIIMQQGIYTTDKWKDTGSFYHRFGLRYNWASHWLVNFALKTHFAKADYGEFGFGYRL
ncbi:MAG: acyloxyacyl hydrolase [Flavobacteriales bacterium]|nr:acyloxyacyl hydrolase [Flavobacteriales bacterium]